MMRRSTSLLASAASLALMLGTLGCPNNGGNQDAGADLTPNTPRPVIGPLVMVELSTTIPVGGNPTAVKLLSPLISTRGAVNPPTDDFTNVPTTGLPLGCSGNFYTTGTSDVPLPQANAGVITISGYAGGTPLGGSAAVPSTITCSYANNAYSCVYTGTQSVAANTPFPDSGDPLVTGSTITFAGAGNAPFGTFTANTPASPGPLTTDLSTVSLSPTATGGVNIPISCSGGTCSGVAVVNFDISSEAAGSTATPANFGNITCATLLTAATSINIPQGAIAAARGCNASGANCSTALQSVRLVVALVGLPSLTPATDSQGNSVSNVVAGQGVVYVGALQ